MSQIRSNRKTTRSPNHDRRAAARKGKKNNWSATLELSLFGNLLRRPIPCPVDPVASIQIRSTVQRPLSRFAKRHTRSTERATRPFFCLRRLSHRPGFAQPEKQWEMLDAWLGARSLEIEAVHLCDPPDGDCSNCSHQHSHARQRATAHLYFAMTCPRMTFFHLILTVNLLFPPHFIQACVQGERQQRQQG